MAKKVDMGSVLSQIQDNIKTGVEGTYAPSLVPTGVLEPAIIAVGHAEYKIINLQCANKLGKTAMVVNILKNIFWENDSEYFDYPAFKDWPFKGDDGKPIKRARILGTPQNTADSGPIREEIRKWWPKGRYTELKAGKSYFCNYETDTGWFLDIMTYEQSPTELEGPLISIQVLDEPAKPQLMGAIMSRFMKGGILMLSQTPINAGPMMDIIDELEDKGAKVKTIGGTIYDNSITSGKLNSKGTKRGLMTDNEIKEWVDGIPLDERDARVEGKNMGKSGKIYAMYDDNVHVRYYDLDSPEAKLWNCYCIMDPHDRRYPAIQWWAVTPPGIDGKSKYICYNEWPTFDTLNGYYYERHNLQCDLDPEQLSAFIKLLDGTDYGLKIMGRGIDPRFARNSKNDFRKSHDDIIMSYMRYNLVFTLPKLGAVETERDKLRELLKYDTQRPPSDYNEPSIFIMPHCRNTRRAFSSHYWEYGKDAESETYKDFCDTARMFLALIEEVPYKSPIVKRVDPREYKKEEQAFIKSLNLKPVALA